MKIVSTIPELESYFGGSLVPTMGALHKGHLALIRAAAERVHPVVVSIFINPTQFNNPKDLERYPRDLDADCRKAEDAGADVAFVPAVDAMYPPEKPMPVPPLPDVAVKPGLEDRFRPGHFPGVCQVVARLFDLVRPRFALFGEKDFQQFLVISSMVNREARWPELELISHPTIREPDSLAMSSRNQLLSPEARRAATGIHRALTEASRLGTPGRDVRRVEEHMRATLVRYQLDVEYAVVRDAKSLMPIGSFEEGVATRALIAVQVGGVRLIDNVAIS